MTNSFKKRPYAPFCGGGGSQKEAKQAGNRALRRSNRVRLQTLGEDAEVFRTLDEVLNPYSMPDDGKPSYCPFNADRPAWMTYRRWFKWVKGK